MTKKTTALLICVVLLLSVSVGLAGCSSETPTLYYNLDGYMYQNPNDTAISFRQPDANGVYHIDFASEGNTATYTTTDPTIVNFVDFLQVMTLEVSSNGEIRKAGFPGKPLFKQDTIQQVSDNSITLNTSIAYNGGQNTLKLAKDCRFYDLSDGGADTQPEIMDEVLAYGNKRGEATDVFIIGRKPQTILYWRLDRQFDAAANATARKPDGSGLYTIPFAADGAQVELKCKDRDVVTAIDKSDPDRAAMGLVLDEEGYITQMLPGYRAVRGRELCSMYEVTAIDGDRFTVTDRHAESAQEQVYHLTLSETCRIYNISSSADLVGEITNALQVGDQVTVYSDSMGTATNIFVHVRLMDSPIYFNLYKMFSGTQTYRQPDDEGFYAFQMVSDGKLLTLKTKEKSIANKIDSISSQAMGMILDGDMIQKVFDASCVTGQDAIAVDRYAVSVSPAILVHTNSRAYRSTIAMLHPNCKFIDMTISSNTLGAETTLKPGDRFNAIGNSQGLVTHVFITQRAA